MKLGRVHSLQWMADDGRGTSTRALLRKSEASLQTTDARSPGVASDIREAGVD